MKTIILPGYSLHNKEWAEEVYKKLNTKDLNIVIHEWGHWNGEEKFDLAYEINQILPKIGDKKVNILAKSIGTWVTANLIPEKGSLVNKIILCGIPLRDISEKEKAEYDSLIEINPKSILVIQNLEDPHGSYREIKDFINKINPDIKVIEKDRTDHDYPYFEDFKNFLSE